MADDRLLAGLRGVAAALDEAAPPIAATGLPGGVPGPDRRPLLALVAAFVLVVGAAAWLAVRRDGEDGSVVTPGPSASTTSTTSLYDLLRPAEAGFVVRNELGAWILYGFHGFQVGGVPAPDGDDDLASGAPLVLSEARDRLTPAAMELPGLSEECADAAEGGGVWIGLCGLDDSDRPREIHVVREDGDTEVLTGPPPDPDAPEVLGFWRWARVSPDGRWVLGQWSGECESRTGFLHATDGSTELRTVTGDDWLTGPDSVALGWAPDGRAVIEIPGMGCGGPQADPGVYLLDPASGERQLVRATADPNEQVHLWTWDAPEPGLPPQQVLEQALAALGYERCCAEAVHDEAASGGVVYEGARLALRVQPPWLGETMPGGWQALPLQDGNAIVLGGEMRFTCGQNRWFIQWIDETRPEIDSVLLFAEELVAHLACTVTPQSS